MYDRFYGLSSMPFSLLPDADFLFPSRRHRRAMNLLDYGTLSQVGFMVITGEVGAGKTTVIRRYLRNVGADVAVGVITNPSRNLGRLLDWIMQAFEIEKTGRDEAERYHIFVDFLVKQYAKGRRSVLIVDEAQNLDGDMLEDLRMLSNVNNEKDQLLQIILVGQPELLETLQKPDLRQFVQRIAVHCHLDPLTPDETSAYIRYRLECVGGSPSLFTEEACAAIHYFSGGVPRLINLLCDQALTYGFSEDKESVSLPTVLEVVQDRARGQLSPFKPMPDAQTLAKEIEKNLASMRPERI